MDAAFGSVEGTSNSMFLFLARWLRSARTTPSPFKERMTASGSHNAFGRQVDRSLLRVLSEGERPKLPRSLSRHAGVGIQRSESIVSPDEFPTSFHRLDSVDRAARLL